MNTRTEIGDGFIVAPAIEGLYIHIPFCVRRCPYCAFVSSAAKRGDAAMERYVDDLILSIRRLARAGLFSDVRTIYIGGGTPSHLGDALMTRLLQIMALSIDVDHVVEFTVEANPESFDERMLHDMRSLGVTRLSLGVQSFDDSVLTTLGRPHDSQRARTCCKIVHDSGLDLSIDLICGVWDQSYDMWAQTLEEAAGCGAGHISVYPLAIEEGTAFSDRVEHGLASMPDEDAAADMMLGAEQALGEAGFIHYEIANYALQGHEALHNTSYWTGRPYLGLGRGAASFLSPLWPGFYGGALASLPQAGLIGQDLATMAELAAKDPNAAALRFTMPTADVEVLDEAQVTAEHLMLGMRLLRGVADGEVAAAARMIDGMQDAFDRCVSLGLVRHDEGRFALTGRGWPMANEVFSRIWGTVSRP